MLIIEINHEFKKIICTYLFLNSSALYLSIFKVQSDIGTLVNSIPISFKLRVSIPSPSKKFPLCVELIKCQIGIENII